MFRTVRLSISLSWGVYSLYTQQWYMSYGFVDSWSCPKAVYKPLWHTPLLSVQWINSWWCAEELSETSRVSCQNKFVKLVHLVGFIIKKIVDTLVVPIHSKFLIPPHLSVLHIGPLSFISCGYWVSLLGVTRPGNQVDYSPPSKAEVKNAWRYTSTPLCAFKAWIRTNLSLTLPQYI